MKKYLVIILTLVFLNCFNWNPKAPEWDLTINIPLVKERYPVIDIVDTLDPIVGIQVGEDSIMQFYLDFDIDTFSIDDSMEIGNIDTVIERNIGDMFIANMDVGNYSVSEREIIEEGAGIALPETSIIVDHIPPFSYTTSYRSDTLDMIDSVRFNIVYFTVSLINHTEMSFDSVAFLPVSGLDMNNIIFIQISSNSSSDTSFYLENTLVESEVKAQLKFVTLDTLFNVRFAPYDSVCFFLFLDSVKIKAGRVKIPSFTDSSTYEFDFPLVSAFSFDLDSIEFSKGSLHLTLDNNLPISGNLTANIEQLDTSFAISLLPHSTITKEIDITGRTFDNTDSPQGSTLLSMKLIVDVDSTDDLVDITADDGISAKVELQMADYNLICGEILEPVTDNIDYRIDIPVEYDDINCIKFAETFLYIEIWNTIGFPFSIVGDITGNSFFGSVSIPFELWVDAGTPCLPPSHSESYCNLAPLLDILPREIIISGDVSLNEGTGILEKNSYITGEVYNNTLFRVAFTQDTICFDTTDVEVEEDLSNFLKNTQSVYLYIEVENHFPFGFDCDIVTLEQPSGSTFFVKRASIPPAPTDENGVTITSINKTIEITLDSLESKILQDSVFSTYALLYVPETDTIMIHARDFLEFCAYCGVKVRVK